MSSRVRPTLFGRDVRHIHCVGVGGMGVGPLAIYLAQLGFVVSGEDDALSPEMREQLARTGVRVGTIGTDCELVACSSAIAAAHPAQGAAGARGLPVVRRGELLAEVTRDRKLVAVCGSHGKTTTTAMLVTALRHAKFPAGYVLGGLFVDGSAPAAVGSNEWVVAEVDESDGTIDRFTPEITVAVNLDWDHPDRYRREEDVEATFAALFGRTRRSVLVSNACPMTARVLARVNPIAAAAAWPSLAAAPGLHDPVAGSASGERADLFTFGKKGNFTGAVATESGDSMTLNLGGRFAYGGAVVRARGEFNATNATAALAAAQLMGAPADRMALSEYPAVRRRQSVLQPESPLVIEDYAHHPAEIRALLASLRRRVGEKGRLVTVFQPHRFTRTAQFKAEFAEALRAADLVYLLDVYSAGESSVAGGTSADIFAALHHAAPSLPARYQPGADDAVLAALRDDVREADLVAFVGAGDIDRKARTWVAGGTSGAHAQNPWDGFHERVGPMLAATTGFVREERLAPKTTMRVGGAARLYAEPASLGDLQTLLREAKAARLPVFVLGRGSNLIVPDEGVNGLVVALANEAWNEFEPRDDGRVWAGAGLRLKNLCGLAAKAGLVGFEFLEGIPGSVGGALRMNAGAMGGWMFDVVEEVRLVTLDGEVRTLPKSAMHVDYRHCAELHDAIAVGALLRPAAQAQADAIKRQMDAYARKRHESQPREPSAGCIFKNPPGNSAGRLIEESGLKGTRVGGAEVSPVHANFIINRGNATSADVLELVRRVRARVREVKGVDLQPEVLLYGKTWEEVL